MEKEKIFEKYGIEAKQIEQDVYKVINTDNLVSVDELEIDLKNCILIISDEIDYKRMSYGNYSICKVYYVILNVDNMEKAHNYVDIANKDFGEAFIEHFKYSSNDIYGIDTIYAPWEV